MTVPLDNALRRQLEGPAVRAHLIFNCFDLLDHSAKDIEAHWQIGVDEAYRLGVRSAPTLIENLLASQSCLQKFGGDVLSRFDGFYTFVRERSNCDCLEWSSRCTCDLPCWRLDLGWFPRGLIVPTRNYRGWFDSLKIFRHPTDARPFQLRLRRGIAA